MADSLTTGCKMSPLRCPLKGLVRALRQVEAQSTAVTKEEREVRFSNTATAPLHVDLSIYRKCQLSLTV